MKVAGIKGKLASVGIISLLGLGYLIFWAGSHIAGLSRNATLLYAFAFILLLLALARFLRFRRG